MVAVAEVVGPCFFLLQAGGFESECRMSNEACGGCWIPSCARLTALSSLFPLASEVSETPWGVLQLVVL